jgi:SAM-dependent methyltransferase
MSIKHKMMIYGLASWLPLIMKLKSQGTGGTDSARYCYSVWLRHLVMLRDHGLPTFPRIVAELGPGDSIGMGLAALLSGCEEYFAFDVVEHSNIERNLHVFEELVSLFRQRAAIPGADEFPLVKPALENYEFPADVLTEERLKSALQEDRIERIRESLRDPKGKNSVILYKVPWQGVDVLNAASVDMVFSQAVLEHVDDLDGTYQAMYNWLKPGGCMSHAIDFKSHGLASEWNGHWAYSDFTWWMMRGRRPYLLNRQPHSTHINLLRKSGFTVNFDKAVSAPSAYRADQLAPRFQRMAQKDLTTSGTFVIASKPVEPGHSNGA